MKYFFSILLLATFLQSNAQDILVTGNKFKGEGQVLGVSLPITMPMGVISSDIFINFVAKAKFEENKWKDTIYHIDVYMLSPIKNDSLISGDTIELKIILKDNQIKSLGHGIYNSVFNEVSQKYMQSVSVITTKESIEVFSKNPIIEFYGENYCNIKYTEKAIKDEIKMLKKFLVTKFEFK